MTFPAIDHTHDPALRSWVDSASAHPDFPIQNLPFGVVSPPGGAPRPGVAIGDLVLDLAAATLGGCLEGFSADDLCSETLNGLFAWPAADRLALRRRLSLLLSDPTWRPKVEPFLLQRSQVEMGLPARIGDYTDFYVGIHHATNVGRLFRPENPLLPNYKHIPIGYHGRASSVRPSGVAVVRPHGQTMPPQASAPVFGPTARLDYELELGIWIAGGNALGQPIDVRSAQDHIAGFCLLNDWSARDVQPWEYQPLGPFLAKSFHTTISPWVVTTEALAPFRMAQPKRPESDPAPLPYLWDPDDQSHGALGVALEVAILTAEMRERGEAPFPVGRTHASNMYWTVGQIVTHHASNGCNLSPGDLLGTGTISSPERSGLGSLLEVTEGGAKPLTLPDGETRRFLEDGDEVLMTARAEAPGYAPIGFGECRARVLPPVERPAMERS
jgi:fumarylacetoacetase